MKNKVIFIVGIGSKNRLDYFNTNLYQKYQNNHIILEKHWKEELCFVKNLKNQKLKSNNITFVPSHFKIEILMLEQEMFKNLGYQVETVFCIETLNQIKNQIIQKYSKLKNKNNLLKLQDKLIWAENENNMLDVSMDLLKHNSDLFTIIKI